VDALDVDDDDAFRFADAVAIAEVAFRLQFPQTVNQTNQTNQTTSQQYEHGFPDPTWLCRGGDFDDTGNITLNDAVFVADMWSRASNALF